VITTFKRPVHLRRAIISVLNQEYSNFEIVVVDDNDEVSAERRQTEKIISGFSDSRLHYVLHDRNLGANVARNTGARHSKGDYIAFLDDDDEFLSNKLLRQIDVALRFGSSNGVLVFCGFEVVGNTRLNKSRWHNNVGSNLFFSQLPRTIFRKFYWV
jgi:glycosyltransferase involved in cell wall biosynthesis